MREKKIPAGRTIHGMQRAMSSYYILYMEWIDHFFSSADEAEEEAIGKVEMKSIEVVKKRKTLMRKQNDFLPLVQLGSKLFNCACKQYWKLYKVYNNINRLVFHLVLYYKSIAQYISLSVYVFLSIALYSSSSFVLWPQLISRFCSRLNFP